MSFDWHKKATSFILDEYKPDVYIHDIYTPNQMLTGRWWLGYIDPVSRRYNEIGTHRRRKLWGEVHDMYKKLDDIIGIYLEKADEDTLIVLSSDHGATPLNRWVKLNNLFAKEGLLKFSINKETGEPVIDWKRSKAVYLKFDSIYINPAGLAGDWTRASGKKYEKLRNKIVRMLYDLRDEDGQKPVAVVVRWEDVEEYWDLPVDRVGDLIISNEAGYGWNEELSADLNVFTTPLKTGYKQSILPGETRGMWTPFVIMGPGVKKNFKLKRPIRMIDQYPTIMHLMGLDIPDFVEGRRLEEIFEK